MSERNKSSVGQRVQKAQIVVVRDSFIGLPGAGMPPRP